MESGWRSDIDSLSFQPQGHGGYCIVHRRAFQTLLGFNPSPADCESCFADRSRGFSTSCGCEDRPRVAANRCQLSLDEPRCGSCNREGARVRGLARLVPPASLSYARARDASGGDVNCAHDAERMRAPTRRRCYGWSANAHVNVTAGPQGPAQFDWNSECEFGTLKPLSLGSSYPPVRGGTHVNRLEID
jgi:hypothetical protein